MNDPLIRDVINVLLIITVISVIFIILKQKGDPAKTLSWIIVIIALPILGTILFFFFGRNYRKLKIFSRKGLKDLEAINTMQLNFRPGFDVEELFTNPRLKSKRPVMNLLQNNSKSLLTIHNKLLAFHNGKDAFSAIIPDLLSAEHHIHIDYYIIEDDTIGNKIKSILCKKALSGVTVRLIYDDIGSWDLDDHFIDDLKDAGVEVYSFLPVRFPKFTSKVNYRNHRKIIVVDGRIGYLGGMNIADRYIEGIEGIGEWRDTQLRMEGDAVLSLQQIFLTDWYFVSNILISDLSYFPIHSIGDVSLVQVTASGPDSDWAGIMQTYFMAISTAREHVYISMPYFIPNESILTALKSVSLSGIDVRILLPEKSDSRIVYHSTMSFIGELLEAGIKVYLYQSGFNHSKVIMVDGILASVGSANLDIRSFDQNFEINALIYNEVFTSSMEKEFLNDLEQSVLLTLEEWEKRSVIDKFKESIARLASPLF